MKVCLNILKILLVIILLLTLFWYLFGEDGPFGNLQISEKCRQYFVSGEEQELAENSLNDSSDIEVEVTDDEIENQVVEEAKKASTIVFTGDVELSEAVQSKYQSAGIEGVLAPELLALMQDATFSMINNEFCFSRQGQPAEDKQYTFRVDPDYVSILTDLGVDVAGLANNHVLDYGKEALDDTFVCLENAGIEYTGAGDSLDRSSTLIIKTDESGRKFGFLAASRVIPFGHWNVESSQPGVFTCYDDAKLVSKVKEARSQVDYLYVMVHWGVEHTTELENHQIQIGHDLIDAGADGVIGMHSHCLQPVEIYSGKPIFYSLGNFIFNENIKSGGAVAFTYDENDELSVQIFPIIATGACTKLAKESNPNIYSTIESMSIGVDINEEGIINLK